MLQLDHSTELKKKQRRRSTQPKITITINGLFRINRSGLHLMNVKKNDYIHFVYDTVNKIQYVGKDINRKPGFKIRFDKNSAGLFNCRNLTFKLIDRLDLPLHLNKLKRIKFEIENTSNKMFNGSPLYRIK